MTLDGMKLSASKLESIRASMTDGESFLSYLFPLLRYHSRWRELSWSDVTGMFGGEPVSHSGYLMQTEVKPQTTASEGLPLEDYTLPEIGFEYLDKMKRLCEQNGATLILVKAPTNSWSYWWYDEWEEQIAEYAAEHGVAYYNFIPRAEEIGLDFSTDTYDGGVHLNADGAEKLTAYFGRILSETHGIPDRRGETETAALWAQKLAAYRADKAAG